MLVRRRMQIGQPLAARYEKVAAIDLQWLGPVAALGTEWTILSYYYNARPKSRNFNQKPKS